MQIRRVLCILCPNACRLTAGRCWASAYHTLCVAFQGCFSGVPRDSHLDDALYKPRPI